MKTATLELDSECGLDVAFSVLSGKWKPLILYHLACHPRRFGELRRLVSGVSEKVLIQQLRELQGDGVVSRTDYHEVPPRVVYAITAFGVGLAEALLPLCDWGAANRARVNGLRSA
jgi:DNA-binding HxlR family transcriptional regulator